VSALAPVIPLFDGRRGETVPAAEARVTKAELARLLAVSEKTIERWMRDRAYRRGGRQVPFEKPFANGWVRFRVSEVESWLAS
jgi:predicted DNA-binding transcriptional regulator AlpA